MVSRELVDYILNNLKMGYKPQQLRQPLLNAGWRQEEIEEAFRQVAYPAMPQFQNASPPAYSNPESHGFSVPKQPTSLTSSQESMDILKKFRMVLIHPGEFFERIKPDMSFGNPFKFYLFILLINIAISVLLMFTLFPQLATFGDLGEMMMGPALLSLGLIIGIPIFLLFLIIGISFITAILHVFAYMFGARKGFISTYKALMYSSAPAIFSVPLFLNLPWVSLIIGGIVFVWDIILLIKGLSKLHEISCVKAFLAVLTPILIVVAIIVVLAFSTFMMLTSYFSGLGGAPSGGTSGTESFSYAGIIDYYCEGGTKATILLRNMGTKPIDLGSCTDNSISGLSATCGSVSITRTDGGSMNAGFNKNTIESGGNVKFTDVCTVTGTEKKCSYRFSFGSGSAPKQAEVTCMG